MNIVHYLESVRKEDGGIMRSAIDMCGLLAREHSITFLTADATDVPAPWKAGGPGVPRLVVLPPVLPGGLLRPAAMTLVRQELHHADGLHLHGMWHRSNYQLSAAARKLGLPYYLSSHGMLDDWALGVSRFKKKALLALVAQRMLNNIHRVHCAASGELEEAQKWFPPGRGRVIPLVFDLDPFRHLPGPELARSRFPLLKDPRPTLLFLSRLVPNKGADLFIEAASQLADRGQEFNFIIAGSGDPAHEKQLRMAVEELKLADRSAFCGHVEGDLKLSLFQASDLFILPTIHENFGFATLEALACGRPAITTPGTMIWRELEQGGGAVIVERNPTSIADAAAALLEDPPRRAQMGENGREWVFQYLDPKRLSREYDGLYGAIPVERPQSISAPAKHGPVTADS